MVSIPLIDAEKSHKQCEKHRNALLAIAAIACGLLVKATPAAKDLTVMVRDMPMLRVEGGQRGPEIGANDADEEIEQDEDIAVLTDQIGDSTNGCRRLHALALGAKFKVFAVVGVVERHPDLMVE